MRDPETCRAASKGFSPEAEIRRSTPLRTYEFSRYSQRMGNQFEYYVSFRATHPTLDPAEIAGQIGLGAKASWAVGEPRKTPKGTPIGGIREESYCAFDIGSSDDGSLAECLQTAVARLKRAGDFLREIRSTGGSLMFYVSWYTSGDTGEVFETALLRDMADLGIELGINAYGAPPQG